MEKEMELDTSGIEMETHTEVVEDIIQPVDDSAEEKDDPTDSEEVEFTIDGVGSSLEEDDAEDEGKTPAPNWVKNLRKDFKEQQRENRELKKALEELQGKQENSISDGNPQGVVSKPTLESCGYDEAQFETKLTSWHEENTRVAKEKHEKERQHRELLQRMEQRVVEHRERAKKLPVKDYEEMEEIVRAEVPVLTQEILLHAADDSSELIAYALGKNKDLRQRLIAEKDPIRAAFQLGQLSAKVKLAPKVKKVAKPEPTLKGGAGVAQSDDFNKLCPGATIL